MDLKELQELRLWNLHRVGQDMARLKAHPALRKISISVAQVLPVVLHSILESAGLEDLKLILLQDAELVSLSSQIFIWDIPDGPK